MLFALCQMRSVPHYICLSEQMVFKVLNIVLSQSDVLHTCSIQSLKLSFPRKSFYDRPWQIFFRLLLIGWKYFWTICKECIHICVFVNIYEFIYICAIFKVYTHCVYSLCSSDQCHSLLCLHGPN